MPTDKLFPGSTTFWYGKNLCRGGKRLYLYDRRDSCTEWKGAVTVDTQGAVTRANVADHDFSECSGSSDSNAAHAIIHADDPKQLYTSADEGLIVLRVSTTQSAPIGHEILTSPAKIIQFSMQDGNAYRSESPWLHEFLKLDFNAAKKLVESAMIGDRSKVADLEKDYAHLLNVILRERVECRLAFRLLCEAKNACGKNNSVELGGITIHAPKDIGEWLAPFGKSNPEEISQVAGMIGSGRVMKAAVKVLMAVKDNADPAKAISDFMKAAEIQNP